MPSLKFGNWRCRWVRGLAFCCVLLASGAQMCFAQDDQIIYGDALVNGWQSYGWATLDFAASSPTHSGSHSIQVQAAAYEALYLHHDALDTSLYTELSFWINGGSSGGQRLKIQATLNGVAQPEVKLANLTPNTWQKINLKLSALGIAGKSSWDGFWIQDISGKTQPAFYVDDISLMAAPAPAKTQIQVDANQVIRTVDARLFSVNAAVWDSQFDTSANLDLLRRMGCQGLRFPGGSLSDEYHWSSNKTGSNSWTWSTSFDKFAHTATNLGARICLTVNYGTGTPAEAADWVRYANLTKQYGCRYWEIGNENYGGWETDSQPLPHDPYTYALRAKEYIAGMKAVDPTIEVGVVAVTGEDSYSNGYTNHAAINPRTGKSHRGWTPVMLATLKELGVTPDFLIYHRYAQNPGNENDASLLQSSATWSSDASDLRAQLADYLGTNAAQVELVCTENNSVSSGPGKQTTSLVNALFLADSLAQVSRTEFNGVFWWDLRNGPDTNGNNSSLLYGWRNYGDYGFVNGTTNLYPVFYAARLLQYFARGGDEIIQAASDYPLLAAYAARRMDGTLTLLVINKSPSQTLEGQIQLAHFLPGPNAVTYSYGIPQDESARTGGTSNDVAQTVFEGTTTNFTRPFAPYSLTVMSFVPASPTPMHLELRPQAQGEAFRFVVQGGPNGPLTVQSSVDLIKWSPWNTNAVPSAELSDPSITNRPHLFFRAIQPYGVSPGN